LEKIKYGEGFHLKNPNDWDPSFVEFINFCLNKDPRNRPSADLVLKQNKAFFSKAKDKTYLAGGLLKGIPTLHERVSKCVFYPQFSKFNELEDSNELIDDNDYVDWNFDISHETHDTWDQLSADVNITKCPSNSNLQEPELVLTRLPSFKFRRSNHTFTYLKRIFDDEEDSDLL
jgi:hypothetical protein